MNHEETLIAMGYELRSEQTEDDGTKIRSYVQQPSPNLRDGEVAGLLNTMHSPASVAKEPAEDALALWAFTLKERFTDAGYQITRGEKGDASVTAPGDRPMFTPEQVDVLLRAAAAGVPEARQALAEYATDLIRRAEAAKAPSSS